MAKVVKVAKKVTATKKATAKAPGSGLSKAGRQAIADAQRRRWERYHKEKRAEERAKAKQVAAKAAKRSR